MKPWASVEFQRADRERQAEKGGELRRGAFRRSDGISAEHVAKRATSS